VVANGEYIASMSLADGRPVNSIMRSNWFIVDVPGKIGLPVMSSPSMQPNDHMSTPLVYLVDPSSISGARYQRVAT